MCVVWPESGAATELTHAYGQAWSLIQDSILTLRRSSVDVVLAAMFSTSWLLIRLTVGARQVCQVHLCLMLKRCHLLRLVL